MGFLSKIVADARAHAPMVRATARDVDRTQAAAEVGEIVEAGPPLSPPSPSGVELAATLPAAPPMAVAPRSATRSARLTTTATPLRIQRRAPGRPARPAGGRIELAGVTCSRRRSDDRVRRPVHSATARESTRASQRGASTLPHRRGRCAPSPRRGPGRPPRRLTGTHARARRSAAGRARDRRPRRAGARSADRADRHRSAARRTHRAGGPAGNPRCRAHAQLLEAIPPAEPRATPATRSDSLVPAPRVEISPSARVIEPRRPERPSPMTEPVAARGVHIGRLEVIVAAPSQPPHGRRSAARRISRVGVT